MLLHNHYMNFCKVVAVGLLSQRYVLRSLSAFYYLTKKLSLLISLCCLSFLRHHIIPQLCYFL